jgi:cysteinyl-tRNA synthetase
LSEEKLEKINFFQERFKQAINNDLNTAQALAIVWEAVKSNIPPEDKYDLILLFDEVLGLGFRGLVIRDEGRDIPDEIKQMIKKRETLRIEKRWREADKIRQELRARGYTIEDTPDGWKLKSLRRKPH